MALSNWATFGINKNKELTDTIHSFDKEAFCEIRKNWLYVAHNKMWFEDCRYMKPYIFELTEGNLTIDGFNIIAKRGPQDSIFVFVISNSKDYKETDWFAGIGSYGYDGDEWVGILPNTYDYFLSFLGEIIEEGYPFDKANEWLKSLPKDVSFYNQGDAYIAKKLEIETPLQNEEDKTEPMIMSFIKGT